MRAPFSNGPVGQTSAVQSLSSVVGDLAAGRMVLLCDDSGGEGALVIAAEFASSDVINFMAAEARGLVCLALTAARCEELRLEEITPRGAGSSLGGSAMVSIEAREGVTTGISAADRAHTIRVAVDPASGPDDLVHPGHVFPLRARSGGVLERPARIEAAVDLVACAGLPAAAVLCEVLHDDGHMARGEQLARFAARHGLATVTVANVVELRRSADPAGAAKLAETARLMRVVITQFAAAVSIVTARDEHGALVGTTANAISPVSLEPPLVLACLARRSETLAAIRGTGRFAINVLAAEQHRHSDHFLSKGGAAGGQEMAASDEHAVPDLRKAVATITCETEAVHPAGDHQIVVGLVKDLETREPGAQPLRFSFGRHPWLRLEEDELVV